MCLCGFVWVSWEEGVYKNPSQRGAGTPFSAGGSAGDRDSTVACLWPLLTRGWGSFSKPLQGLVPRSTVGPPGPPSRNPEGAQLSPPLGAVGTFPLGCPRDRGLAASQPKTDSVTPLHWFEFGFWAPTEASGTLPALRAWGSDPSIGRWGLRSHQPCQLSPGRLLGPGSCPGPGRSRVSPGFSSSPG